jgi:four helix bundle protein
MATIKHFEDIEAWKLARELCLQTGKLIERGSFKKNFRLIGQIEGSSGSNMDNIAEGFERGTRKEFIQYLGFAKGSCGEFRSQLYRATDLEYINQEEFNDLYSKAVRISAMLQKLLEYLLQTEIKGNRNKGRL